MASVPLNRRAFTKRLALGIAGLGGLRGILHAAEAPAIVRGPNGRPQMPGGVMAGDVQRGSAVLWSRCDRAATMIVEYDTTDAFNDTRRIRGPVALEDTDFTAKLQLGGLPPGQDIFYRISFEDLTDSRAIAEPVMGRFRTPAVEKRDLLFTWSGDTCGQGYGIDAARGGMRTYETMRRMQPDFFVHVGDTIYADNPIEAERPLDNGTVWKNLVTDAKSKVAETLSEFRGNHFYNALDENVRRFNASVPGYYQWDDHEVLNNWYPGEILDDPRYREKNVSLLAARARRAFFDCLPVRPHPFERIFRTISYGPSLELFILDMRSYRGPNSPNRQGDSIPAAAFLGAQQLAELKLALAASTATWKVLCSDMPLGLMVRDGETDFEALANGDGPPLGRELEIASLLRFLRDRRIRNTVWITADVHHCSSIHYDPGRAVFQEFEPFWEFVSGPLHAGTFAPPPFDNTFGPELRFLGIPADMKANRPPSDGLQFFGTVRIAGDTEELTVAHWNTAGDRLWSITLPPART